MPKSETWSSDPRLETMNGMDSAGSCDSVVSANSRFSDDSLEHLSAEEKACLMFLEETIESLDTEEDSGLSNDEPDQLPSSGNLATKLADLSASMSKSKLNSSQEPASKEPIKKNVDSKPMQSYLVPTPLVVASGSLHPISKPVTPADRAIFSKSQLVPKNSKPELKQNLQSEAPALPLEANVPSTKPMDSSVRTAEGPLPRGPLSYDALVHLRRNASTKKTPLCPTVDHTIELAKHRSAPVEGLNLTNLPRSDKSHSEFPKSKTSPPAVAPKPKKVPAYILVKTQSEGPITTDLSCSAKHAADPQAVRMEALQKLGLLKDEETEKGPLPPNKSDSSLDPGPHSSTKGPSHCNPSNSPSFCSSQVPKNRLLQSSANFHHHSSHDQQPMPSSHQPAQSSGLKTAGLGRSASLESYTSSENCPELQDIPAAMSVKTTSTAEHAPHKPSNIVGYTVMVVPGMGADRKEALRKLGLLKD
ncbi:specifically androgen-regulated gene protein [Melanotaenia boesemani]|uniref:specifically androgen-regulated gene protein n=1 Tax=Melanotaenia boesemani TaxID=1250792 RepID=UPI001C057871|nr:specifically androgen-regulated gene protein [Melanotaenia boesemani]